MASWRHLSRIIVMQSFFEYLVRKTSLDDIYDYNLSFYSVKITDDSFAKGLLHKMQDHQDEIDVLIQKYAPDWPIDKINMLDRVVLTLGIAELIFPEDDVPVSVAINESIELAKEYGDDNSGKFINGVLNAVAHSKDKK